MQYIVKAINSYLKEKDSEEEAFTTIYNDLFPDESFEGLISRHEAGQANVRTYIDGSSEGSVSVSYYARYSDAAECREILTKIINILDDAEIVSEDDSLTVSVSAVNTPQFISTDDKGFSIYMITINADFERS